MRSRELHWEQTRSLVAWRKTGDRHPGAASGVPASLPGRQRRACPGCRRPNSLVLLLRPMRAKRTGRRRSRLDRLPRARERANPTVICGRRVRLLICNRVSEQQFAAGQLRRGHDRGRGHDIARSLGDLARSCRRGVGWRNAVDSECQGRWDDGRARVRRGGNAVSRTVQHSPWRQFGGKGPTHNPHHHGACACSDRQP